MKIYRVINGDIFGGSGHNISVGDKVENVWATTSLESLCYILGWCESYANSYWGSSTPAKVLIISDAEIIEPPKGAKFGHNEKSDKGEVYIRKGIVSEIVENPIKHFGVIVLEVY